MTTGAYTATALRAAFARQLAELYGEEVPAYTALVEETQSVNASVMRARGQAAEEFGTLRRVTAERHGAIRVGTPKELEQLARVLAAFGMHPVGFYDLRDCAPTPLPIVATAFRPIDTGELAENPFRLFVSLLVPEDPRFFDKQLTEGIHRFLSRRTLFPPRLLTLADRAAADGGISAEAAQELLTLAVNAFRMTQEPVDRTWYERLQIVSSVAADIAGVPSTHINHLTPRVLDIDLLHRNMIDRGVAMLDGVEGPPRWPGPEMLLRQTSFRALAERRRLREPDGTVVDGTLSVRFGEVESRGVALTPAGRDLYTAAMAEASERARGKAREVFTHELRSSWESHFPSTLMSLACQDLGHFTWEPYHHPGEGSPPASLTALLAQGWVRPRPIVYEDFLPRSAAGIFHSNLTGAGNRSGEQTPVARDADWMSGVLGRRLHDPQDLYTAQSRESLTAVAARLGLPAIHDDRAHQSIPSAVSAT